MKKNNHESEEEWISDDITHRLNLKGKERKRKHKVNLNTLVTCCSRGKDSQEKKGMVVMREFGDSVQDDGGEDWS